MMENAWLIPILPLVSFCILLFFGRKNSGWSAHIAILLTLVSFICSVLVFLETFNIPTYKASFEWLTIGSLTITAGYEIHSLNALMLLIVSFVSLLVQIYSKGYMQGDSRFPVFYSYLGLFTFAMLALVMSPNLLQLYIFWELVGLGSFLLIGFYFSKESAKRAAKKAFIMTRIGDVGLLIGMILLFWQTGSFEYSEIFKVVEAGGISSELLTLIAILIFVGAIGKSGQFPLHSWLPDAMEGPTPVSALIHAATMVAAGVYLVAAMYPIFLASETALTVVAVTGGFTAIFAATIAITQKDIKRVLAYSTVSQLGFMFLALGTAGYVAGMFHLMTHAFFKALLFLAAGSVIHAIHTQNIEEMGGLWKKLKWTGPLFLIGTLAISGFPLLSGFFSKDEILISTWENGSYFLFALAVITSFLTAFYMFRLFFLVFAGEQKAEGKESPMVMVAPMTILALLAIFSGYVNTPWFGTFLGDWLAPHAPHHAAPIWIMFLAIAVSLLGIGLAYLIYVKQSLSRSWLMKPNSSVYKLVFNKYYIDEIYAHTVVTLTKGMNVICQVVEKYVVEGATIAVKRGFQGLSSIGARIQSGQTQQYGMIAFVGLAVILVVYFVAGGYSR